MTYFADIAFYENISEWVMDYNGLADPFTMKTQIGITNTYTAILYFKAELMTPGANYTNYSVQLGSIGAGLSDYKAFTFDRALPGAKVTDNLTLRLTAYTDAGYSSELCHDEFAVPFYMFDHTALALVDHDTFDTEEDFEGWAVDGSNVSIIQKTDYYINAPYSLAGISGNISYTVYGAKKTFVVGAVTEAFIVLHYYKISDAGVRYISVDGKSVIPTIVLLEYPISKWYRLCFKIPVNKSVEIKLGMTAANTTTSQRYDDVWVVTHTA